MNIDNWFDEEDIDFVLQLSKIILPQKGSIIFISRHIQQKIVSAITITVLNYVKKKLFLLFLNRYLNNILDFASHRA